MEAAGGQDAEALATHWRGANRPARAAEYAIEAAAGAGAALAFDRAARLYRMALQLSGDEGEARVRTMTKLATSLVNAGRAAEAARVYLDLARSASLRADARIDAERRAAEQLLLSGHIDEGLQIVRSVLRAIGMRVPESRPGAVASLVLRRLRVRMRGSAFRQRSPAALAADARTRIDTCWSLAAGLSIVEPVLGADFQARHLLLALDAGEPYRVARAFAMEVAFANLTTAGVGDSAYADDLARRAEALARDIDDPHALALCRLALGLTAFVRGEWARARGLLEEAEAIFRGRCAGVQWELDNTLNFRAGALTFLGEIARLKHDLPRLVDEAQDRGDLFRITNLRTGLPTIAWLASGDSQTHRAEVKDAIGRWSQRGFHLQHWLAVQSEAMIDLYEGKGGEGLRRMQAAWPAAKRELHMNVQLVRVNATYLRGRCAVAAAADAAPRERGRFIEVAERDARSLDREATHWAASLSLLLRAGNESVRGRPDACAALLDRGIAAAVRSGMRLYELVARMRRATLLGGDAGRADAAEVERVLRTEQIADTASHCRMLLPGVFPPSGSVRSAGA
jgi:hypothetical protein